jgi:hypothetical protein
LQIYLKRPHGLDDGPDDADAMAGALSNQATSIETVESVLDEPTDDC